MRKLTKVMAALIGLYLLCFTGMIIGQIVTCNKYPFNGAPDNERDDLDYYYIITGGKFPTGNIPNGDNASGGTVRFLADDSGWGYPIDQWQKDDWFPQNAGFALTLKMGNSILYDNNGIEDGSYGDYYNGPATLPNYPGLYMGYSMANNWDWVYATYFKLSTPTTFDTMIGYFDGNGWFGGFDPLSPYIEYRMNIWSSIYVSGTTYMPKNTGGFTGDVLSTDCAAAQYSVSPTGVDRIKPNNSHDPIWRLLFKFAQPVTLPAGIYFFSHDAVIATPDFIKRDALEKLNAMLGTSLTRDDRKKLEDTIDHLTKSLNPNYWIDKIHLQPKHGEKVFDAEKDAVNKLEDLLKNKKSSISDIILQSFIDRLVKADQALATIAIKEAEDAGGDAKDIEKAKEEMVKAQEEKGKKKHNDAIEHYKNAWKHAQHAMQKID